MESMQILEQTKNELFKVKCQVKHEIARLQEHILQQSNVIKNCNNNINKNISCNNNVLNNKGYKIITNIAKTLQGNIFNGIHIKSNNAVIIKRTEKSLHKQGITIQNGSKIKVAENILKERTMLYYLQSKQAPLQLIKMYDFIEDSKYYYLIQEHGGSDLFKWVLENHKLIHIKKIGLKEWKYHVKIIFSQIVNCVWWLHNICSCCHLDISLENMVIKGAIVNNNGVFINHGTIKIIDFGLSEYFPNNNFKCNKFVGKISYKSPELYKKTVFDASKNDIWSIGVCLYMMTIGAHPYKKPSLSDKYFKRLWDKQLYPTLKKWKIAHYMDSTVHDILYKIFVNEKDRGSIDDISKDKYVYDLLYSKH